jgi:hypothetical protein
MLIGNGGRRQQRECKRKGANVPAADAKVSHLIIIQSGCRIG